MIIIKGALSGGFLELGAPGRHSLTVSDRQLSQGSGRSEGDCEFKNEWMGFRKRIYISTIFSIARLS